MTDKTLAALDSEKEAKEKSRKDEITSMLGEAKNLTQRRIPKALRGALLHVNEYNNTSLVNLIYGGLKEIGLDKQAEWVEVAVLHIAAVKCKWDKTSKTSTSRIDGKRKAKLDLEQSAYYMGFLDDVEIDGLRNLYLEIVKSEEESEDDNDEDSFGKKVSNEATRIKKSYEILKDIPVNTKDDIAVLRGALASIKRVSEALEAKLLRADADIQKKMADALELEANRLSA